MISEISKAIEQPNDIKFDHGQSLRVAKAIFGVGSAELAREFGVTPSGIDKWGRTRKWNVGRLTAVAKYFDMTPEEFSFLALRALSSATAIEAMNMYRHLKEHHPDKRSETANINHHYQKIVEILEDIEDWT